MGWGILVVGEYYYNLFDIGLDWIFVMVNVDIYDVGFGEFVIEIFNGKIEIIVGYL